MNVIVKGVDMPTFLNIIIVIIGLYIVISLFIGLCDLSSAQSQESFLNNTPRGDIGYYVIPKKIYGVHNWIFIPSWLPLIVTKKYNKWLMKKKNIEV